MSFNICLKHIGGERKSVPVEYVAPSLTYISIRWGQSGIYDLNLAKNVLTARSAKAQRKGKAYWVAEDINAVRKMAREYLEEKRGIQKIESDNAFKRHAETMPAANPRIGLVGYIEEFQVIPYPRYNGDPEV